MNYKILALIAVLLMGMSAVFAAPAMPHPVYGKVMINDNIIPFAEVKLSICDFRTSSLTKCIVTKETSLETDETGSFVFEVANIYPLYREGDLIKLDACDGYAKCEKIVPLEDTATMVNFGIGVGATEEPSTPQNVFITLPETELSNLKVKIAGIETSLERLREAPKLRWWKGWIGIVLALMSGIGGGVVLARKIFATTIKKHNEKKYGK